MADLRSLTDDFKTEESPTYGLTDARFYTSMLVASVLMILTIGAMIGLANSPIADGILWLYEVFWFLGVIVMSGVLSLGWYVGLKGIDEDRMFLASIGVGLSVLAYGGFGGAILSMYSPSLYVAAISITGVITIGITLVLTAYIFTGERDMRSWLGYSGGIFLVAIVLALIGSFWPPLQLLVIVLVIIGFVFDLGFEIWYCTRGGRSPLANGFAIYFAFAGVFVHIMQFVLQALAE